MVTIYEVYSDGDGDYYRQFLSKEAAESVISFYSDLVVSATEAQEVLAQAVYIGKRFGRVGTSPHVCNVQKLHENDGGVFGFCVWGETVIKARYDYGLRRWLAVDSRPLNQVRGIG